MEKQGFAAALMAWHRVSARDLPWHGETDPYRIWLSEIMLQQTRTETVKRYYAAFLEEFPDVFALARADEARVFKRWEGLGYYSRARNLHAAAKLVASEYGGRFPDSVEGLRRLPGVGEYVSGAVASIAFGKRVPALDGNQARVLARVFRVTKELRSPAALYDEAMALMPEEEPGEYNQALMGLGAMICTPRHPRCETCPVRECCAARAAGDAEKLPVKPEKRARRSEDRAVALLFDGARVAVRRRPEEGLLAGLWEFPGFDGARTEADVQACLKEMGVTARFVARLGAARHVFTHLEWHMTGWQFEFRGGQSELRFVTAAELGQLTLPTALRAYREEALRILAKRAPLLKKKTMARAEWRGIEERRFADRAFEWAGFRGQAGLLMMDRVDEPFYVPTPWGGQNCITHSGYSWVQLAPAGENFWATAMFDGNGRFIECYFDITRENHALAGGRSWFIDLLLDYVFYPDGSFVEADREELNAAHENGAVTEEEFLIALAAGEKLSVLLKERGREMIDLCADLRGKLLEELKNGGEKS